MSEAEDFTQSLAGRRALVTGAGMGIGQGIALELARQGAAVAVHYAHSEQGALETVAEIQRSRGQAIEIVQGLSINEFSRSKIDATVNELKEEKALVGELLPK